MTFDALAAQVETPNGNGWRHELKIPTSLRKGMTQTTASFQADVQVDLSTGGKAIVTQYHADGTGTIVKVYVSDTNESTRANNAMPARLGPLLIVPLLQQSLLFLFIVLIVKRYHIKVES